jgi:hypothetical protein
MEFKRLLATTLSIALLTTLSPAGSFAQAPSAKTRTISAEKMQVESDIIGMQKDGVNAMRQMLALYQKSGLKETGKMSIAFKLDSTDYKVAVNFKLDEYQSISNLIKGDASLNGKGSITVSATQNTRDYSAQPDADFNYPKKEETIVFVLNFAGEVKLVDNQAYFTLKQFDLMPGAILKDVVELADMIEKAQKEVVGKTFQLPVDAMDFAQTSTYLSRLEAAMQILEQNSLLEVASKKGNISTMRFKRSTLQAINLVLGNKKSIRQSDLAEFNPKNGAILFSKNGSTMKLSVVDRTKKNNSVVLTKANGAYKLDTQIQEGSRQSGSTMSMTMEANRIVLGTTDWSKYTYTDTSVLWENGYLNLKSSTTPRGKNSYTKANNFVISGPLDIWGGNANLTLTIDGVRYGNIVLKTVGNSYSLALSGDYAENGTSMSITMLVEAMLESGEFTITAPEKFEKLNSLDGLNL